MKMTLAFLALNAVIIGIFQYLGVLQPGYTLSAFGLISVCISILVMWLWLNRRDLRGGLGREVDAKPPPDDWKQTWERIQKDRSTER